MSTASIAIVVHYECMCHDENQEKVARKGRAIAAAANALADTSDSIKCSADRFGPRLSNAAHALSSCNDALTAL